MYWLLLILQILSRKNYSCVGYSTDLSTNVSQIKKRSWIYRIQYAIFAYHVNAFWYWITSCTHQVVLPFV